MSDTYLGNEEFDQADFEGLGADYIICSTGRSGSSLLTSLLILTGNLGVPHEYIHPQHAKVLFERYELNPNTPLETYMASVRKKRTTPNGIFGVKLHLVHLINLVQISMFEKLFPTPLCVFISREDVVAQAVSYAIAEQTNKWTSRGTEINEPKYNAEVISRHVQRINMENNSWEKFFLSSSIEPLRVTYEEILSDPNEIIKSISTSLGIHNIKKVSVEDAHFSKQSNELNQEWIDTFRQPRTI
jgi:LPS sulfotransferase NodH